MIKNVFYFMLRALVILEMFTFLLRLFDSVEERLDKKAKLIFKIYNVTD